MDVSLLLVLWAANDSGLRVILLVLVLVAVALILTGGVIATLTLYNLYRSRSAGADRSPGE